MQVGGSVVWGWLCRALSRVRVGRTLWDVPWGVWVSLGVGTGLAQQLQPQPPEQAAPPCCTQDRAAPCTGILCLELPKVQIKSSLKGGGGFTAGKDERVTKAVKLLSVLAPGQFPEVTAVPASCVLSPEGTFWPLEEVLGAQACERTWRS